MFAVALSLLFGIVAFAAIAEIASSVRRGARRGRLILADLAKLENAARRPVRVASASRPHRPAWQPRLAAA